mmetsp:Transcript_28420/g.77847  ORF Transcript_28420/g.77847 Transcript_28420/m.77847 type:complete len:125 (-) Transcript_28420:533-907(-)
MLAFDFWTVKNVSGRLLVGLRWWSEVRDDGATEWKYESRETGLNSSSMDVAVFWVGLIIPAFIWFLFGIGSVFRLSFDWLLLIVIALALSGMHCLALLKRAISITTAPSRSPFHSTHHPAPDHS